MWWVFRRLKGRLLSLFRAFSYGVRDWLTTELMDSVGGRQGVRGIVDRLFLRAQNRRQ
ncbi:hypothetical protein HYDPIDRAFT_116403 [Hydnomerulius pinastri MD-312]|uniref:Uncharacterized protein n=1 Tax=Hydnomerulius pinastri MD-312 TaxID=994086 RepID=A0A0C9WBU9_9AGAM|nr:hypothetical protein HYDPIDRAFT_116403 [Hydnomerulius pinastri MD-312]